MSALAVDPMQKVPYTNVPAPMPSRVIPDIAKVAV